ncbi:Hypothetical predicted protein [Lecanosticta acicola]|uniref:DUF3074 domain-containing protein n=1 Tax=Lecanosticta acicola TaxID=111012 RepID=A0AAI8Z6Q0_9PEZI|nr:Hypothetical predicted protein [Lecanosticta acicola]
MAELHDALKYLGPVEWNDVPQDNLQQYLAHCFTAGELICNSVPPNPNGTAFKEAKPHHRKPNAAKSHKEIHPSAARSHPPDEEHGKLQKNWGKPMKFKASDNPLQVSVYKMAGHDRHGAWFARQSVHEGLGFDKFKRAMMREFSESLAVSGGPGAGAVRGLAADRRLQRIDVDGVGRLEVYQLSAQFPGPVTPRDFMAMLLESDDVLSERSAAELEGGKKHIPRHFMILSRPVEHPDAPHRSGFVRGQYESVEMIREIPLSTSKTKSTPNLLANAGSEDQKPRERGHTVGFAESRGEEAKGEQMDKPQDPTDDAELNPVEWTMITRSDPGGGIPRFLVERGTPETMLADVHKFFDWACSLEHIPHPDDDLQEQQKTSERTTEQERSGGIAPVALDGSQQVTSVEQGRSSIQGASTEPVPSNQDSQGTEGLLSNIGKALEAGVESYAPVSVSGMLHQRLHPTEQESSDDSSDASSIDSFLSAEEMTRMTTAPEEAGQQANDSADTLSLASGVSDSSKDKRALNSHDKEVQKLVMKREKLDQQLAKKRMAEESKLKQSQEKEESEQNKVREEMEKKLKKTEEKHQKELEKLERKKAKEAKKAEEKRRKKDDQNKISLVTRERDEFRNQSDLHRRENTLLREQIAELQHQNTVMAQKLGKIGGPDVLKTLQENSGHKRSKSVKSVGSAQSTDALPEKKADGKVASSAS